jgi:hypothetical protein
VDPAGVVLTIGSAEGSIALHGGGYGEVPARLEIGDNANQIIIGGTLTGGIDAGRDLVGYVYILRDVAGLSSLPTITVHGDLEGEIRICGSL